MKTLDGTEIKKIFALQKTKAIELRQSTAHDRIQSLKKLKDLVLKNEQALCEALFADFSKSAHEVWLTEIYPLISEIDHVIKNLKRWTKPQYVKSPLLLGFGTSFIQYQPKGTSLIVSPWNYPLLLSLSPLVSAFAAGCTCLIKPSELTSHTSSLLAKILNSHFDSNLVAVIEGGVDVASQLLELPFNHIFFTGSTVVGQIYMQAAAKHLSSITLELGGKSPVIVESSANLDWAAEKIIWGKFINAGQTCVAPDYILIDDKIWPEFENKLIEQIQKHYPDQPTYNDLPQIINERHFARLNQLLADIQNDKTAEMIYHKTTSVNSRKISPTVVKINNIKTALMSEEIFGPILPVITYHDLSIAVEHINSQPKPLALYLFSKDSTQIEKVLTETSSGGVCINDVLLQLGNHHLPFGGINHSGLGSSHGYYGFKAFSHERAVYKQSFFGRLLSILYPPYNQKKLQLLKRLVSF